MSRISYFQRFSQKENHATNNTLLILRRFYDESPFKIERVVSSLIDEECRIGLAFTQQIKGTRSVPDALIVQQALRIFFETKRGGDLDEDQISRHIDTIAEDHADGQTDILIGLTKEPVAPNVFDVLKSLAKRSTILFATVTFSQIMDVLREECAKYEHDLLVIVEDFEQYLSEENLLEERNQLLPIFPCGTSYSENEKFSLYYEPANRPCKRNYRIIGIYARKCVSLIGEVEEIVTGSFDGGQYVFETELGKVTNEHKARVKEVIEKTEYYDLDAIPHRYYLVYRFLNSDIRKVLSGGIRGFRYLDLRELLPDFDQQRDYPLDELAELLKGSQFH